MDYFVVRYLKKILLETIIRSEMIEGLLRITEQGAYTCIVASFRTENTKIYAVFIFENKMNTFRLAISFL